HEELKLLTELAKKHSGMIKIHIKIDSGMNRLGISDKVTLDKILSYISQTNNIKCDGIYTHYATSDSDIFYLEEQYNNFRKLTDTYNIKKHSANSAAIFQGKKYHMDMVRAGIMLYGYIDKNLKTYDGQNVCDIIKPAMSIYADIAQIKSLDAGSYIGYDKAFKTQRHTKIAIISIGYGDGYPRLINKGYVIIKNKRCKILGKVCMDLMAVDVTNIKNISYNDKAEIFGKNIGADVVARWNKTICYDILCSVTKRVKKVWV
ncbi:MAG TPA: alanine racemase, partial [Clostridiales bacterium]|nr:alanine racemase [Clostridiales bacterium]